VYRIAKTFTFEAAHHLSGLPEEHKCARTHGHSYRVEIVLESEQLTETGFVDDFAELKPLGDYTAHEFQMLPPASSKAANHDH
jgi:6-pyruvoyltetrahydropterin/6-carboxytetrahydropterin synthase